MSIIRRVTTFEELDTLLPLMNKLHEQNIEYYGMFTEVGYLAWLISSFPNLYILAGYEGVMPFGYIIVGFQFTYGMKEAIVYEAYCEGETDIVEETWEMVLEFCKSINCKILSCYTERGKAIARKYGFEIVRSYLTKEL